MSGQLQLMLSDLSQLQLIQSDLSQLRSDYDTLSDELAAINEVYPPRDFSSVEELKGWLASNDVSELPPTNYDVELMYSRALQIQADALKDCYIISVDFDVPVYIACVAIIDGDFWWWYPDTDEPNLYSAMGKVSRD